MRLTIAKTIVEIAAANVITIALFGIIGFVVFNGALLTTSYLTSD